MNRFISIAVLGAVLAGLSGAVALGQKSKDKHSSGPAHPAAKAPHPAKGAQQAAHGGHPTPSFSGARPMGHPAPAHINRPGGARAAFVPSVNRSPHANAYRPSHAVAGHPNVRNQAAFRTSPNFNRAHQPYYRPPNVVTHQGINNRNFVNRPEFNRRDFNTFNRQNIVNGNRFNLNERSTRNDFNVNRWNGYNRNWNWEHGGGHWGRTAYWNRPWYGGRPWWYWNRPWAWRYGDWHHGYWNWLWPLPAAWYAGAPYGSWLDWTGGDSYVYANPYYGTPTSTVVVPTWLNYSQPIPTPTADEAALAYPAATTDETAGAEVAEQTPSAAESEDPAVREARRLFDDARDAFTRGEYPLAEELVDRAIQKLQSDAALHEFRGLTLFAQGKYAEAAATLYAVLAAGPGWNWETVSALYPDAAIYTQQLRTLEDYVRKHPDGGYAHFLLAYHYLVLGYKDQAVKQLSDAVRLTPNDKLSAQLLKALTQETTSTPPGA